MGKSINYQLTGFKALQIEKVRKKLEATLQEKIVSMENIPYGKVNLSYHVVTNSKDLFCKFSPVWYKHSLERETWALKTIKGNGGIVPNVVCYIKDGFNYRGHELLVLEYISGSLLSNIENKNKLYKKIFETYNILHSIAMPGWGWLDRKFKGQHQKWQEFLYDVENIDSYGHISLEWKMRAEYVIKNLKNIKPSTETARLLYGDYNDNNFIVTEAGDVCSLDFQNCFAGDPLYDIGIIVSKSDEVFNYLKYLDYFSENKIKVIYLYALRHILSMLAFYINSYDDDKIEALSKRFLYLRNAYEGNRLNIS